MRGFSRRSWYKKQRGKKVLDMGNPSARGRTGVIVRVGGASLRRCRPLFSKDYIVYLQSCWILCRLVMLGIPTSKGHGTNFSSSSSSTRRVRQAYVLVSLLGEDNSVVLLLEPLHGIFLCDLVTSSHLVLAPLSPCYSLSWPLENEVEIHTFDGKKTKRRVRESVCLLDAKFCVCVGVSCRPAGERCL